MRLRDVTPCMGGRTAGTQFRTRSRARGPGATEAQRKRSPRRSQGAAKGASWRLAGAPTPPPSEG
eukprot:7681818-Alexandrium_andersonii.AAC.1